MVMSQYPAETKRRIVAVLISCLLQTLLVKLVMPDLDLEIIPKMTMVPHIVGCLILNTMLFTGEIYQILLKHY